MVLVRITVATAEPELHHSVFSDAQGSELLQHDALRHPITEIFK
jgi:hypothetical protein